MDLITMARDLGKALQEDERYLAYMTVTASNDEDEVLQEMIRRFNEKRVLINREVSKADKDQATLSKLDSEFKELYKMIMDTPGMIAYNAAKQELDSLLQYFNQILLGSANGQDPDTIEPATGGCGGSCESCEGCH